MQRIETVPEFAHFVDAPNVILFSFAAWSGPAHQSRVALIESLDRLGRTSTALDYAVAELDTTEQHGLIWDHATNWLTPQTQIDGKTFMYAGAGSVAWVRDGVVVDWIVNALQTGASEIADRTVAAFAAVPKTADNQDMHRSGGG